MYKKKRILAIIPARGGSKGLPGKNIRPLFGKPLLVWTIDALKDSGIIDRIFVSTDSNEIATIARDAKIEIPFLRNQILAKDNSLVIDAVLEALHFFRNIGQVYDIVMLMEPTSPLRTPEMIVDCINKMINCDADSVATFSELEVPLERIWCVENQQASTYMKNSLAFRPRQSLTKVYKLNGLLYAIDVKTLDKMEQPQIMTKNVLPYVTPREISTDIDDINDFDYIDFILKKKYDK